MHFLPHVFGEEAINCCRQVTRPHRVGHTPGQEGGIFPKTSTGNWHPGIAAPPKAWLKWVISDCVLDVFGGESPINRLYQNQFLMTAAGVSVAPS